MESDHILWLGRLVGNFHSLEVVLRAYLIGIAHKEGKPVGPPYWSLNVGDVVASDEFTDYDSLGQLIDRFNDDVATRDSTLSVDRRVVDIRDLLAHGRVAALKEDLSDMKIIKFSRPDRNREAVVASALMSEAWYRSNVKLVYDETMKVHTAFTRFANGE